MVIPKWGKNVGEIVFEKDGLRIRNAPAHIGNRRWQLAGTDCGYSKLNRDIAWPEIHYFGIMAFSAQEWGNVIGISEISVLEPVLTPAINKYYKKYNNVTIMETIEWRLHILLENGESMSFEAAEFYNENNFRVLLRSVEAEAIASINNEHNPDNGNKFKWKPARL